MRLGIIAAIAVLAACSAQSEDARTYRYPNPQGSAAVVIDIGNHGGAAGFVVNTVNLEGAGRRADRIRIIEHLDQTQVIWADERHALFCFVGSMDRGSPRRNGTLAGQTYQIDFLDGRSDRRCLSAPTPPG